MVLKEFLNMPKIKHYTQQKSGKEAVDKDILTE
jgi:hypothetical protein